MSGDNRLSAALLPGIEYLKKIENSERNTYHNTYKSSRRADVGNNQKESLSKKEFVLTNSITDIISSFKFVFTFNSNLLRL